MKRINFEFDNEAAAKHFCLWLCEQGEQDYWQWMEYREAEEKGDITATQFHYHGKEDITKDIDDPTRYGQFLIDDTVRTTCSRLDKDK